MKQITLFKNKKPSDYHKKVLLGIRLPNGNYIGDIWDKGKLEKLVKFLDTK